MSKNDDSNYISVGSWMFILFILAIPVIGLIMILVWALVGDNESRKNYCRAILAWFLILVMLVVLIGVLGNGPAIRKQIQTWTHKAEERAK